MAVDIHTTKTCSMKLNDLEVLFIQPNVLVKWLNEQPFFNSSLKLVIYYTASGNVALPNTHTCTHRQGVFLGHLIQIGFSVGCIFNY